MKRMLVLGAVLFGFAIASGSVSAQIGARPVVGQVCQLAQYDQNGDGVLTPSDIVLWAQRMRTAQCFDAEAVGACQEFDNNGDGRVDGLDVEVIAHHWSNCVRSALTIVPPGRPR